MSTPHIAKRPCPAPGCPALIVRGERACPRHLRQKDQDRGTRHQRGYTNAWARYSKRRLAEHPWCEGYPNGYHGKLRVLAEVTDHIISAKARPDLFDDSSNHQSLCGDCNRRKGIVEEGGLGR